MSIDVPYVTDLLKQTLIRKLGSEVDLIFRYGSRIKGTAHAYSDLDISYTPVHATTWDSITVMVNDVLCDLYPLHWGKLEQMASFDDFSTTVLLENEIIYARNEEVVQRFHSLGQRLQEMRKPEMRPVMIRKALEMFQKTGYPFYLLWEAAQKELLLTCLQQSQSILRTVLHCLAIVNQAPIDTRKLSEVLALPRLPVDFARNVIWMTQAQSPTDVLTSVETLLTSTRVLLLNEQRLSLCKESSFSDVFDSAYPELKGDLQHIILAAERRDLFSISVISLYHELMVHIAEADTGMQYSGFNSLKDYEQDLQRLGFPDLVNRVIQRDFEGLKKDCALFDLKMKEFLVEHRVPLHTFTSMWDFEKYLKSLSQTRT